MELVGIEANELDVAADLVIQRVAVESADRHPGFLPRPPQHLVLGTRIRLHEDGQCTALLDCLRDPRNIFGREFLAGIEGELGGKLDRVIAAEVLE